MKLYFLCVMCDRCGINIDKRLWYSDKKLAVWQTASLQVSTVDNTH